ncbi:MAG: hypothetical protein L3K18_06590 [Thermoplasmata archaeon]|nr:hypothetical protein [Thermoplasmata archaeon]
MSASSEGNPGVDDLLSQLHSELARAPGPVREIEVGIQLSIELGRMRPAVACGGCTTPLEFEGIPARTNAALRVPFRLIFDGPGVPG